MADWVTISSLATAGGTLVLAGATFMSVRSANRAARVAELSLLAGLRPLLVPSHLDDAPEKVGFIDGKWVRAPGGGGVAEATDEVIYLVLALRNVGSGIALLHGWRAYTGQRTERERPELDGFQRLTRDIYVPAGSTGFWQGSLRDPETEEFAEIRGAIETGEPLTIDVLYGDHEGGQRVITRFALLQREDGTRIAAAGRHWNVDRPDPR
jgi:hypothetical protein